MSMYFSSLVAELPRCSRRAHSPLEPGYIRLVRIDEIKQDGFIACSLIPTKLDSTTVYDALSYAWSKEEGSELTITCNGLPLSVTTDLHEALLCHFHLCQHDPIWIDAICIDQGSSTDKAAQVPLMGQYYAMARTVRIWLGPSNELSELATDQIPQLVFIMQNIPQQSTITDQWLKENSLPTKHNRVWEGIHDIFMRPWFRRLWTVQEFALATNTVFMCGCHTVEGAHVAALADEVRRLGITALTRKGRIIFAGKADGYHFLTFPWRIWEAAKKNDHIEFELALQLGRFREATKAVDRVYGILGMIDERIRGQVRVEYGKKPEAEFWKLYVEIGKLSVQRESSHLKWLSLCQSRERPVELPSWCPNLHSKNEASLFLDHYFAGFTDECRGSPQITFTKDDHLIITGIATAVVEMVALNSDDWDTKAGILHGPQEHAEYTIKWIEECVEMAQKAHGLPKRDVLEALTRTLIADTLGGRCGFTTEVLHELWAASQAYLVLQSRGESVESLPVNQLDKANDFLDAMRHTCRNRRFFSASGPRLCVGPEKVQVGDLVVVFKNARMPFVLHKLDDKPAYSLLGPAYVRGHMMGQVFDPLQQDQSEWQNFEIA